MKMLVWHWFWSLLVKSGVSASKHFQEMLKEHKQTNKQETPEVFIWSPNSTATNLMGHDGICRSSNPPHPTTHSQIYVKQSFELEQDMLVTYINQPTTK